MQQDFTTLKPLVTIVCILGICVLAMAIGPLGILLVLIIAIIWVISTILGQVGQPVTAGVIGSVTAEVIGNVTALQYAHAFCLWEGTIGDGGKFYVQDAASDSLETVAKLHVARLKDHRIQGIIVYQARLPLRGRLTSVAGVDEGGETFIIGVTGRDREAVRGMMQ